MPIKFLVGLKSVLKQQIWNKFQALGLCLVYGKEEHIRAQCSEKLRVDPKRRQLVTNEAEIGIMAEFEEKKLVETWRFSQRWLVPL